MAMVNGTTFGINQSLFVSKNTHYQTKEITHFPSISRTDVYVSQPDDSNALNIEKLLKPMTADTAHSLGSRYTITNMTRNQYSSLLRELRDMGIITPQDFSVGYGGMIPYTDTKGKTAYTEADGWPRGKEQTDFAELLQNCANTCRNFMSSQGEAINSTRMTSDSYDRLSKIFNQIQENVPEKEEPTMEINRIGNGRIIGQQSIRKDTAITQPNHTFQELFHARAAEAPVKIESAATTNAIPTNITILPGDSVEVKLEKLKQIASVSDYTGMSYEDIYTTIWNRYNDAFGGNLPAIICPMGPLANGWDDISNQFYEETGEAVIHPLFQEFYEQGLLEEGEFYDRDDTYIMQRISDIQSAPLGYSGMSFEEKKQAIYSKYQGKTSYIDFLNMQGELQHSLVYMNELGREASSDYLSSMNSHITYDYVYKNLGLLDKMSASNPNPHSQLTEAEWDAIYAWQFDSETLFRDLKSFFSSGFSNSPSRFEILEFLNNYEKEDKR